MSRFSFRELIRWPARAADANVAHPSPAKPASRPLPVAREIQVAPPEKAVAEGTPIYPPIDPGLLIDTPDNILATQHELISLLRRNLGLPEHEFEAKYLAPLRRAAELINLLPATRDKHHAGAGGLFRLCCALAVRSAQSAEGKIFAASEGVERRRATEQGWRHAAFLTGLVTEICRPLTEMLIVNDAGDEWSPYLTSLTQFARDNSSARVYVRWYKRDDHRSAAKSMTSWAVNAVVGNAILAELHSVKPLIVETIFGVASGAITSADNSTMAALINDVRRRVIERDNELAPTTYGKLTQGAHLEPYLLDAMRSLLRSGKWKVNVRGSRCHYGTDGFFIAWRQGSEEMLEWLREQNIEGVPSSRETLEDMLGAASIITPGAENSRLHMVSAFGMQPFPAVRLQSPGSVIGQMDIKPVSHAVKAQNVVATAAPASQSLPQTRQQPVQAPLKAATQAAESPVAVKEAGEGKSIAQAIPSVPEAQAAATPAPAVDAPSKPPSTPAATSDSPEPHGSSSPAGVEGNSKAPAKAEAKTRAAKSEERTEESYEPLPPDLLLELGAPACRDLAVLRHHWNRSMSRAHLMKTPEGLAVAYQWIDTNMSMQWTKLQTQLQTAGYIHTATISGRNRVLMTLPFPKGDELGVVLLNAFLRKAGFEME